MAASRHANILLSKGNKRGKMEKHEKQEINDMADRDYCKAKAEGRTEGIEMTIDSILAMVAQDIQYNVSEEIKHMELYASATEVSAKRRQYGKVEKHRSKAVVLTMLKIKIKAAAELLLKNKTASNDDTFLQTVNSAPSKRDVFLQERAKQYEGLKPEKVSA